MRGYRMGAKQEDINNIRRMNAEGKSIDEISRTLLVIPSCVKSFVNHFNNENKPKKAPTKAKGKAASPPCDVPEPPPLPESA